MCSDAGHVVILPGCVQLVPPPPRTHAAGYDTGPWILPAVDATPVVEQRATSRDHPDRQNPGVKRAVNGYRCAMILRLALLGDSMAAGRGAARRTEAPGA